MLAATNVTPPRTSQKPRALRGEAAQRRWAGKLASALWLLPDSFGCSTGLETRERSAICLLDPPTARTLVFESRCRDRHFQRP